MSRKRLKGFIEGIRDEKTAIVSVSNLKKHPKYKKYIKTTKRFKANCEPETFSVGDKVFIEESKPISKDKRWVVLKIDGDKEKEQ